MKEPLRTAGPHPCHPPAPSRSARCSRAGTWQLPAMFTAGITSWHHLLGGPETLEPGSASPKKQPPRIQTSTVPAGGELAPHRGSVCVCLRTAIASPGLQASTCWEMRWVLSVKRSRELVVAVGAGKHLKTWLENTRKASKPGSCAEELQDQAARGRRTARPVLRSLAPAPCP